MKSINETLEMNKVLSRLSDFADSKDGKALCVTLKKINDKNDLYKAIGETDAAVSCLKSSAAPTFAKLNNLDEAMVRLAKEAPLSIIELLNISNCLDIADKLISYRATKNFNSCLDVYFNKLDSLKYENDEIKRAILSENEISDNASSVLQAIRRKKMLLKEKIHTTANRLLNTYGQYLQEPVIANKDGAICLPVKSEFKNKVDGTVHSVSGSQFTIFIEPKEIIGLKNEIAENDALEQVEISKILYELSKRLVPYMDVIKANYDSLVALDFAFAKAKFANELSATLPIINDNGKINLINARHPLIKKDEIIPLNINLGIDFNTLIITGPNTGGKTVSLKTVGLIELMGLSGLFIPCRKKNDRFVKQ